MKLFIAGISMLLIITLSFSRNIELPLWSDGVPNSLATNGREIHDQGDILLVRNVQEPGIAEYLPAKRQTSGQAVVISPGGAVAVCAKGPEGGHGQSLDLGRGYLQTSTDRFYDWLSFLHR